MILVFSFLGVLILFEEGKIKRVEHYEITSERPLVSLKGFHWSKL